MLGPQGQWVPRGKNKTANPIPPGLYGPDAVRLYRMIVDLYRVDPVFVGQLASYAMRELDWRDLKVCLAGFLLVQRENFLRDVGEAMILSMGDKLIPTARRLRPKDVLRIGELLRHADIVALNRQQGFGSRGSKNPPLGRYPQVVAKWLLVRERVPQNLMALVQKGYKETVKSLARSCRYQPEDGDRFFSTLRWKQDQAKTGHRMFAIGQALTPAETWEGLEEDKICERIRKDNLSYSVAVGKIPAQVGLTKKILRTLIQSMSDSDIIIATPALEEAGLLDEPAVMARFDRACKAAISHRAVSVSKNVKTDKVREKLGEAVAAANTAAVKQAAPDRPVRVLFLLDISGSQEGGIEISKQILPNLLTGLDPNRVHAVAFNTDSRILYDGKGTKADLATKQIQLILKNLCASGGTNHSVGFNAFSAMGVRKDPDEILILLVVGDEAGEQDFGPRIRQTGLIPDAIGFVYNPAGTRGNTVRSASQNLQVPFSEVSVGDLKDPYQIPRFLRTLLDARVSAVQTSTGFVQARFGFLDRISNIPLLVPPVVPPRRNLPLGPYLNETT